MNDNLRVTVKIFGAPAMTLENRELTLELARNATIADLLNAIPVSDKSYIYVVRDGIRLSSTSKLNDGDEILIVPPIAGG